MIEQFFHDRYRSQKRWWSTKPCRELRQTVCITKKPDVTTGPNIETTTEPFTTMTLLRIFIITYDSKGYLAFCDQNQNDFILIDLKSLRKYQPNEIAAMEGKYQPNLNLDDSGFQSQSETVS